MYQPYRGPKLFKEFLSNHNKGRSKGIRETLVNKQHFRFSEHCFLSVSVNLPGRSVGLSLERAETLNPISPLSRTFMQFRLLSSINLHCCYQTYFTECFKPQLLSRGGGEVLALGDYRHRTPSHHKSIYDI